MHSSSSSADPAHATASLTAQLAAAFSWVLVLTFSVSAVAIGTLLLLLVYWEPAAARLRDARRAQFAGHQAMLDEETSLRGFVITRDQAFLEPLRAGQFALGAANEVLGNTLGADPEFAPLVMNERLAEQRWADEWALDVERLPADVAASTATAAEGKALFDEYRKHQRAFLDALDRRVAQFDAERRRTLEIGVGLSTLIGALAAAFAARQRRVLRAALTEPLARLLRSIGHVRDGDLSVRADEAGPRELAHVARALNEMTEALAEERAQRAVRDAQLAAQTARLRLLLDSAREFSESLNLRYVLQSIGRAALDVGGGGEARIWLLDEANGTLVAVYDSAYHREAPRGIEPIPIGKGAEGRAAKYGRTLLEPPEGVTDLVAASAYPMVVGSRVVGVIALRPTEPGLRDPGVVEVMETLAMHAGSAIESARLHQQTEERSKVDPLTTLLNRRRLDEDLHDEIRRSARYDRPLAFLMLDVDHFKRFNDTHGHTAGDVALQAVAEVMRAAVRTTDSVYRYGGEEFAILLRETGVAGARDLAERLCQRLAQRFQDEPEPRRITASIGVAEFDPAKPTAGALVEAADRALYEAKGAGRNRVVAAPPAGPPLPRSALPGSGSLPASAPASVNVRVPVTGSTGMRVPSDAGIRALKRIS
jgi:diguanylate cyclase (GGDEF)-like protein